MMGQMTSTRCSFLAPALAAMPVQSSQSKPLGTLGSIPGPGAMAGPVALRPPSPRARVLSVHTYVGSRVEQRKWEM